ncbi:hypothetical protein Clacol_009918 [Clathrus columnatus]|uniref:Uncharacterized protein n=1 Tax=Clathrus columnatus TaxID=1419009 RepID=A0AAV5AUU9_9AGAM|nr:hypothetical protein Clacol_009918 [Clathrus columnatus]
MNIRLFCALLGVFSLRFALLNAQRVALFNQESDSNSVWELTLSGSPSGNGYVCTPITLKRVQRHRLLSTANDVIVNRRRLLKQNAPSNLTSTDEWLQIFGYAPETVWSKAEDFCSSYVRTMDFYDIRSQQQPLLVASQDTPTIELFPIAISGPSKNRVDITFFADGYLLEEKEKFLRDATRLAEDISYNQTFASVKPLLNFWAAFSPSQEAKRNCTVYGLYRNGTELRAVYCSKLEVARLACLSLYSESRISTASDINGPLVLRHELAVAGEEYDGGFAYFGVNAGHNISTLQDVTWAHWLSDPQEPNSNKVRIERSNMPFQVYAWTMLNTTTPWSATFTSSGNYAWYRVRFSLSGLPNIDDLSVYLDGEDLHWQPRQNIGMDRWHYDIIRDVSLNNSVHELRFKLLDESLEGLAQLCSAEIIEYGDEHEFNTTEGNYGIYPTYSIDNITSYRPTDEQCLMRQVTSHNFCDVCKEGLWLSLLSRINLIDDITLNLQEERSALTIEIMPVPLGQFRSKLIEGEMYSIQWEKDGVPLTQYTNSTKAVVHMNIYGNWRVTLDFHTPEVRMDSEQLLHSEVEIQVKVGQQPLVRIVS